MKLRIDANTNHETPEDWYGAYGDYAPTVAAGDVDIQKISPTWMLAYADDRDLIAAHPNLRKHLTDAECEELVARARLAWDAACDMHCYREMAVYAYRRHDLDAVEDALETASHAERQYGDDPATRTLSEQLLVSEEG